MKYKRKAPDTVEAVRWYPNQNTESNAYDPSGVEYTDTGWYLEGVVIQPGDYIVEDEGWTFVYRPEEFDATFELAEKETHDVVSTPET